MARAITFDVTRTLIHSPRLTDIYAEVLGRHGIAAPPGELARLLPLVWQELDCLAEIGHDRFAAHPGGARGWWRRYLERLVELPRRAAAGPVRRRRAVPPLRRAGRLGGLPGGAGDAGRAAADGAQAGGGEQLGRPAAAAARPARPRRALRGRRLFERRRGGEARPPHLPRRPRPPGGGPARGGARRRQPARGRRGGARRRGWSPSIWCAPARPPPLRREPAPAGRGDLADLSPLPELVAITRYPAPFGLPG